MRTVLAAFAVLLLAAACQTATPEGLTEADRAAINEVDAAYAAAALAGDWAALGGLWTEDAVYQVPEGPAIRGRDAIVTAFQEGPTPSEMESSISAADGSGNWAWARGTWRWVAPATDETPEIRHEGSFLWVLEKQPNGNWLIDTECYNLDTPDEGTEAEVAQIEAEVLAFEEGKPAAFSTLDPDRLMELWADGEISSVSFGEDRIIGQAEMQAFYKNLLPSWAETQMSWLPGSTIDVLSPELALFQGTVRQATTNQAGVSYIQHVHFTDLLRKIDGEWKIQRNHVSGRVIPEG